MEADPLEQENISETARGKEIEKMHRELFREYIQSIQVCPEPTWGELKPNQRRHYQNYLAWYESILES